MRSGVAQPPAALSMVLGTHTRAPQMEVLQMLLRGIDMPHLHKKSETKCTPFKNGIDTYGMYGLHTSVHLYCFKR